MKRLAKKIAVFFWGGAIVEAVCKGTEEIAGAIDPEPPQVKVRKLTPPYPIVGVMEDTNRRLP